MIRLVPLAIIVAAVGAWLIAAAGAKSCDDIGSCESAVSVALDSDGLPPEADAMRVCVDGRCRTSPIRSGSGAVAAVPVPDREDTVFVEAQLLSEKGSEITSARGDFSLEEIEPAGEGCELKCWAGSLEFVPEIPVLRDD